jgi:magnesium transporter
MTGPLVQPEIHELIEGKDFATLKAALRDMEVHDVTDLLATLEGEELAVCFRLLGQQTAADIFGDLPLERQEELLETMSSERVAAILNDMPPDERTELLEELPGELAQRLLASLRGDEHRIARDLLAYPEESIGRLMTPEYVAVRADWTVDRVLQHLRKVAAAKETLNVIYVIDDRGKLLDELRLEQVVLAEPDQTVRDMMDEQVAALEAYDDREDAIELFRKYEAVALPAVNSQGVLVGIVTVDDLLDVVEEESTEDFQKMAGLTALEYSYFGTGFLAMMGKRLPWLILLLAAQSLTAVALTRFHGLPEFAVLVIFMPLINSPAGNTGSQMAGLILRGLAVQEMGLSDWWRVLGREIARGAMMGLLLGTLGYGAVRLFGRPQEVAIAVALAMVAAVTLANLFGSMLPFVFKRVGVDPAVTSAPFVASMMDVSAIVIYFSIAAGVYSLARG